MSKQFNEYDIAKMYQEMELELISSLKRNLKSHIKEEEKTGFKYPAWQALKLKELERVKAEHLGIIEKHTSTIPRDIKRIIKREYKQGRTSAQKLYDKSNEGHGHKMNESFFHINNKKVDVLINEINSTTNKSKKAIFRMMNDKYRSTIFRANFFLENGATSISGAIDMALKDFIKAGINCIEYSDGRRVNIADYTRMAVRTASQRAMLYAEGDFRKERGHSLVIVTKHNTSCKLCQPWENKVLIDDVYSGGIPDGKHKLVSEAMKAHLMHPNCRHGLPTYYPELDEVYDDIAKGKTLQEEEDSLRDSISQYYQRVRRQAIYNNDAHLVKYKDGTEEYVFMMKKYINTEAKYIPQVHIPKYRTLNTEKIFDNLSYNKTKEEENVANWLSSITNMRVENLKDIDDIEGVSNPDYIFKGEYWDLKSIEGNSSRTVASAIGKHRKQADNFIIDITKSGMRQNEAKRQIEKEFINHKWLKQIILKENDKLVEWYTKFD